MKTGLHIGTIVDEESLLPLTDSIVRIMTTPADQETIRAALHLIGRAAEFNGGPVTVTNSSINGDQSHTHHHYTDEEPDDEMDDFTI